MNYKSNNIKNNYNFNKSKNFSDKKEEEAKKKIKDWLFYIFQSQTFKVNCLLNKNNRLFEDIDINNIDNGLIMKKSGMFTGFDLQVLSSSGITFSNNLVGTKKYSLDKFWINVLKNKNNPKKILEIIDECCCIFEYANNNVVFGINGSNYKFSLNLFQNNIMNNFKLDVFENNIQIISVWK